MLMLPLLVKGAAATVLDEDEDEFVARTAVRPSVLSADDVSRYRLIFELQRLGEWSAADKVIATLQDDVLLGHVSFQRYMHPTKYRSSFAELQAWMEAYADHPGAYRIHRLALRRQPKGAKAPRRPAAPRASMSYADTAPHASYVSPRTRTSVQKAEIRRIQRTLQVELRQGAPSRALRLLEAEHVRKLLDPIELDQARAAVAAGYFFAGKDAQALKLAAAAAERARAEVPVADWTAGLAAWRLRDVAAAEHHFTALAHSQTASGWMISAGAFWAARASLAAEHPADVNPLLTIAAKQPRTFYGLLAARQLGVDIQLQFDPPPLSADAAEKLLALPAVRRTVALAQVGDTVHAEQELRRVYLGSTPAEGPVLLALAHQLDLPETQMRLARGVLDPDDTPYDAALFPVPPWQPEGGFAIDRALLFAFIRQESRFSPAATSHRGARGLMQLMPRTASWLAGGEELTGKDGKHLYRPDFNMELGQKYLRELLTHDSINGNLFRLAVAYNAGPGNLRKWLKASGGDADPLLFIETLPAGETRHFVERVLTNFWIYRERLGQDTPSLDAVATGHAPIYLDLDSPTYAVARRAGL